MASITRRVEQLEDQLQAERRRIIHPFLANRPLPELLAVIAAISDHRGQAWPAEEGFDYGLLQPGWEQVASDIVGDMAEALIKRGLA